MTEQAESSGVGSLNYEIAIVGGGIVGLATAVELQRRRPGARIAVLERGGEVGGGQTGSNSGVIHSGIYYAPGSLKARLCVEGARLMYEFCDAHGIPAERCGKVIVATEERELAPLDELARRGGANGVPGLRRVDAAELRELEPHVRGIAALHSPNTGIVDFAAVAKALRADFEAGGGAMELGADVTAVEHGSGAVTLRHSRGEMRAGFAVFCAGLAADRLAVMDGADPDPRIVPFRGSYLRLRREKPSETRTS